MSEPPTFDPVPEDQPESNPADKTQPAEEIQNDLEQLTRTAPNSQESLKPQEVPTAPTVPRSEWETIRDQLREKPYDPNAWNKLVQLAESSGDIEKIKESYEELLEVYPNTSSAQIAYLEHFLNSGLFPFAEGLFKRFLKSSPSVDLWRFYLTYVRRVNVGPATRDTVRQSYEFALNRVGQDKESGEIWSDYIQFLKSGETNSTWEEQQKMDALRKVYHRAVQIPLDNVERLWSELETFETQLNRITAKKFMADLSPSKVQAVTVLRGLQNHIRILFPPSSPSSPRIWLPGLPTFNPGERALVGQWKTYLKYEEGNPLEIDEKDRATLVMRVQGVYKKALIRMRFFPEIWYMAYVWTNSVGKHDEAVRILEEGMKANPRSFVLHFAYCELLEARKDNDAVHKTFDKLLVSLGAELQAIEARVKSADTSLTPSNTPAPNGSQNNGITTGIPNPGVDSKDSSFNSQNSDIPPKTDDLAERRADYGLVWIMYMRFARRAESLKSSRAVFSKSRRDRWTPWEVYEAAALMEYHVTKAVDVPSRIFEKGMELFSEEVDYVLRYLGFLISVNDNNNARALFERVIGTFESKQALPLWERWARYEYQYGDLEAAQKLEKRIAEVYPNDPPLKRFAQRHKYLNRDAIADRDLGYAMARQNAPPARGALGRTETQQSLMVGQNSQEMPTLQKRPGSPDYRKREREGEYGLPQHKRPRGGSPLPRERERERERWDLPQRRRYDSPGWDRDRDRDAPPPRRYEREREEERSVVPLAISQFLAKLPEKAAFEGQGPVFRVDDMLSLVRNAVIPGSAGGVRPRSPIPPPRPTRPPPDYGPYQGPGGGRGVARRY